MCKVDSLLVTSTSPDSCEFSRMIDRRMPLDIPRFQLLIHCAVPVPDRWKRSACGSPRGDKTHRADQAHHTGQYHWITNRYAVKKSLEEPAHEGDATKPENRTAAQ